jgi:hypothetical protein
MGRLRAGLSPYIFGAGLAVASASANSQSRKCSTAGQWLNKIVAVGVGERRPNGAAYEVYEIL